VQGGGKQRKTAQAVEHRGKRAKCKEVVGKAKHHRQWHAPQELVLIDVAFIT